MNATSVFARSVAVAALAILAAWVAGGCQSIAGIEEVQFDDPCNEYCAIVMEACKGDDLAVYADEANCLATCGTFDTSDITENANTLACRTAQATTALNLPRGERTEHCAAAGPGGGSRCATSSFEEQPDCEGYCSLYISACEGVPMLELGVSGETDCIRKCRALEYTGAYNVAEASESGDTLGCRLYYASLAATNAPETNCAAASLSPGGACTPLSTDTPNCDDYCRVVQIACTSEFKVYQTEEQCQRVCAETPIGDATDLEGDSVGCRTYHSYFALTAGAVPHCPHSGPLGNGQCSEMADPNCVSYCRLAKAACSDEFTAAYEDTDGCLEVCRELPGAEPTEKNYSVTAEDAQRGNTLQCRTLNAAIALEKPDEKATYCPAVFGEDDCSGD